MLAILALNNKIQFLLWFLKKLTQSNLPQSDENMKKANSFYELYFFCSWLSPCLFGGFDSFVLDVASGWLELTCSSGLSMNFL